MLSLFKKFKQCAVLAVCLLTASSAIAEVVVVVHPSNTSTFSKSAIKKIFLGKTKSFSNGRTALLLSSTSENPITKEFNEKVIGKTGNQVNAYWSKMMFTGKGTPPQELSSAEEILSAVSENKDAISYMDSTLVNDSVKIVGTF
jgi:ABC-type phosphate transport system substrate-binding protein